MAGQFAHITTWLFDLDNVLYPPEVNMMPHIRAVFQQFLADELNMPLADVQVKQKAFAEKYGDAVRGWIAEEGLDITIWQAKQADLLDLTRIPHTPELAARINTLPGRKIIFTNGHTAYAQRVLERIGVADCFDGISTLTERDKLAKPDPKAYEHLMKKWGIIPDQTLFIEDSVENLEDAHKLGIETVLVYASSDGKSYVDHEFSDLSAFLDAAQC